MRDQVTYSVVIPYYNVPDLLMRCLASIPDRPDIQIVLIDDGSSDGLRCPQWERVGFQLIAAPRHGGAGYARNLGLAAAKGEWLLFADSDDYFLPAAWDLFDRYSDSRNDIVFFGMAGDRGQEYNAFIDVFLNSGDDRELRFLGKHVMSKMIRRSLIASRMIRFEEVPFSNDIVFSARSSEAAGSIAACREPVYYFTKRAGSLTSDRYHKDREAFYRSIEALKHYRICRKYIRELWRHSILRVYYLYKDDKEGFGEWFFSARRYDFPRWKVAIRVMWNMGPAKGVAGLCYCFRLLLKERGINV